MREAIRRIYEEEDGHALPFWAAVVAGAGVVMVGIGAASGIDWLCVVGGIGGGLGVVAANLLHHSTIDADLYGRIDRLMGKGGGDSQ